MPTKILITGGTGLIGMNLSKVLLTKGYEVIHLSRNPSSSQFQQYHWNIEDGSIEPKALDADIIVHLAGEGLADSRWTKKKKRAIYNSRILSTRLLYESFKNSKRLKHFISSSAIGYYGMDTGSKLVDESTGPGNDYVSNVVVDWEQEADNFNRNGIKTTKIRTGVVLDKHGGALPRLSMPIRWGVGSPLGTGDQYVSWIHISDLIEIFIQVIENEYEGIYNAVAPNPVTNRELTKKIAQLLKRPLFLPAVPGVFLKLVLGEMSAMILGGNNVKPKNLLKQDFKFEYPQLTDALKSIYAG
ncbi:MAG: TIGR01777 family oxidoreductase [Cyclobacteriaceae bacterium]